MSLARRILGPFSPSAPATEGRSVSLADLVASGAIPSINGSPASLATKTTDDDALTVAAVYACISLISDVMASLPVDAYAPAGRHGARSELDPRPSWLDTPNDSDLWPEIVSMLAVSLLTRGNAYASVARNADGTVAALHVLDPARVSVLVRAEGIRFKIDGAGPEYGPETILHIPGLRKPGEVLGMAPLDYARSTVSVGLAAQRFGAAFLRNGGFVSAHVEAPGPISDPGIRQMKAAWSDAHAGVDQAGKLAVVTEGAKIVEHSATPEGAQLLETRSFTVADVARIYRIPTYLLSANDKATSWGAGVAEQGRAFAMYTLQPWLTRLEARLSALLVSEGRPGYVRFNLDALVRANVEKRYSAYKTALDAGFLSVNEVRALEDLDALPPSAAPAPRIA